ncbi:MAG TPA: CsbD family protein [Pseudonocardiaceae bacterium]|nr:CsbD family protein [Pseudonocardiaceae bacterium]
MPVLLAYGRGWFRHTFRLPGHSSRSTIAEGKIHMGILDKIKDKAEQFIGEAREKIGQMTGNESLENAGTQDQLSGDAKKVGHDLRDKAAGAVHNVNDKLSCDKE